MISESHLLRDLHRLPVPDRLPLLVFRRRTNTATAYTIGPLIQRHALGFGHLTLGDVFSHHQLTVVFSEDGLWLPSALHMPARIWNDRNYNYVLLSMSCLSQSSLKTMFNL